MPKTTRIAIRLALLHLVLGVAGWTVLPVLAPDVVASPVLLSRAIWHLLAVGWLTQLIFGVAYWLFPTHKEEPKRGSPMLAGGGLAFLNLGLLLRLAAEPATQLDFREAMLAASALFQVVGVVAWVWVLWPRVKGK